MKNRIAPTTRRVSLGADAMIVSKTDLQGRITYANRTFMRTANFPERSLIGVQHNIVRHPDMPRGVFRLLWDTLKAGEEFFGYVKNLTSDGDYYWVFANITPDRDLNGNVVGYYSVRKCPAESALAVVEPLYREMLSEEARAGAARAPEASVALLQARLKAMGAAYEGFVLQLQGQGEQR